MSDDYREPSDADAPPVDGETGVHGVDNAQVSWDRMAEQSVVGSMMIDRTVIDDVTDELRPTDFYLPAHEVIARAIHTLYTKGAPTDPVSVGDELTRTGKMREANGAAYLHELTEIPTTAANAGYMAGIVAKHSAMRRLVAAGIRIQKAGQASEGDVEDLLEKARVELDSVSTGHRRVVRPVGDTLDDVIASLREKPTYFPTPWEGLTKKIGGFAPGQLTIVAARPGTGKTIAVLQIAATLAHEGMVAFSSLEMSEPELQKRLLSSYGSVHQTAIRSHSLTSEDEKRLIEARIALRDAPIFIDATAGVTLGEIRAHARAVARRGQLRGVVVDYLQLVEGEGQSRNEVVGSISRGLKQLAKDLQVPVIAAAQLRRAGIRKGSDLPTLEELRESGSIEQDADIVLLLHRDKIKTPHNLTVVVAKNRHGEDGQFTLHWAAAFARLENKKWSPTALLEKDEI